MSLRAGYCLICKRYRRVTFERIAMIGGRGVSAGTCGACARAQRLAESTDEGAS